MRHRKARPGFLELDTCLDGAGSLKDRSRGWKKYEAYLQWVCEDEPARKGMLFDRMSKGWALGSKEFKLAVLDDEKNSKAAVEIGEAESAEEIRELMWSRRLDECLSYLGKTVEALASESKSAPWKVAIAAHLKSSMLCRNGWLGERLNMGSVSGVSRLCSRVLSGGFEVANETLEKLNAQFKE